MREYYPLLLVGAVIGVFTLVFTLAFALMKDKKKVILTCPVCLSRNYSTNKNANNQKRLELKKYCPTCKKHTVHKETK